MNKRFLSTLLTGAFFLAATSMFVSCKDYDDDIANLQDQINKRALASEVSALQSQLTQVSTNAQSALTKAEEALTKANAAATKTELEAVKATAEQAGKDAATAIANAAAAQKTADDADKAAAEAAAAAKKAQETADQAVKEAVDAAAAAAGAGADAKKALEQIGKLDQTFVTADELKKQLDELKADIAEASDVAALALAVKAYGAAIDELYSAVTSVDLIDSFTGRYYYYDGDGYYYGTQGRDMSYWSDNDYVNVYMTHGLVPEDSKFGDNELGADRVTSPQLAKEYAQPFVVYKKGEDVKDPQYGVIVRVNPVNADITASKIVLLNSQGEVMESVKIGTPERFTGLICKTRGSEINSGLWLLPMEIAEGVDEEEFAKQTYIVHEEQGDTWLGASILFAVGINNTEETEADRYVVSSYDILLNYEPYEPANHFTFNVQKGAVNKTVEEIHNRWTGVDIHGEEQASSEVNPELIWMEDVTPVAGPADAAITLDTYKADQKVEVVLTNPERWDGDFNDIRFNENLFVAAVGETFTINALQAYTENGRNIAIDSMYVVLDKVNAIESHPSEINAWNSYEIEGINKVVDAAGTLDLTVKSKSAYGDVIGFRVYAVNRDGSLVDPDGRAFYVLVTGEAGANTVDLTVQATKAGNTDKSDIKDLVAKLNSAYEYELTINANNPAIVTANGPIDAAFDYFQFVFLKDKNTVATINPTGSDPVEVEGIASANKIQIVPQNIENLIDGATYSFTLTGYETIGITGTRIARQVITITLTKIMPNKSDVVEFRPKQEVEDGTGKFIAYMIPNKGYTYPAGTDEFCAHQTFDEMVATYDATTTVDNGFKNLTNVFYNLSEDGQNVKWDETFQFDFAGKEKHTVKFDENATDPNRYMLDVKTEEVDGVTEHAVAVSKVYRGISSTVTYNADGTVKSYEFAADYAVASNQSLVCIYACWHHAQSYFWKTGKQPALQWSHEGLQRMSPFTDILTKNTYDPAFFGDGTSNGKTLAYLYEKKFLIDDDSEPQLNTAKDGSGQKNPYYVPTISGTMIYYTQNATQTDAAPVADHTEYLIFSLKDAFGHKVTISLPVTIKRP